MSEMFVPFFVILSALNFASPSLAMIRNGVTSLAPPSTTALAHHQLHERQNAEHVTTCGYFDGNPKSSRTADPGYGCRVDTARGLWGFCPTTVMSASDCGLAGFCVDSHSCTSGCGRLSDRTDITTFSCEPKQFCSTVLLLNGPDQSYEYIACGTKAGTDTLLPAPKSVEASTTPTSSSTPVPSSATTNSISQLASTATQQSPLANSPSPSPPISASSSSNSPNIGAIVGGVIAALTVICLTILGVLLIRRKHLIAYKTAKPPEYTYDGQSASTTDTAYGCVRAPKGYQWDSSHGPVEMQGEYAENSEPFELMGRARSVDGRE
ncbi:hypothetical protein GGP41_009842 [Bipolaris sorokiniana]|uniref:Mid2 domain-containing protein n=1 Tax=Cochliobolus sativus TaxID=45130 RepID=A0A8H5ZJ51_COCSA|nr:hypothetical protein GGP41_009842 [Bipolaris sorokiniana]